MNYDDLELFGCETSDCSPILSELIMSRSISETTSVSKLVMIVQGRQNHSRRTIYMVTS